MARIAIVDDHPIVREGIESLLKRHGHELVASGKDAQSMLANAELGAAELIFVDLNLPDVDGLSLIERAKQSHPALKAVLLTSNISREAIDRAFAAEVDGILLKESAIQQIRLCAEAVLAGERWYDPEVTKLAMKPDSGGEGMAALSRREAEIVEHILAGLRNKEIARLLDITEGTVKSHLHNIYDKLGVSSRLELARFASKSEAR